jgi:hypothetical protein
MRITRRRSRSLDPLASPEAVWSVCVQLRERLPGLIPEAEQELLRFLYAVRHVERHPATDTRRGRPSRWKREDLIRAAGELRAVLQRETSGRVSLSSFIGQYLPLLNFPADVVEALSLEHINLQEAAQLARLTPERLDTTPHGAAKLRREIIQSHTAMNGSQNTLRGRVRELIGEAISASSAEMTAVVQKVDELLEIDPADKRHFFYEEMKRLYYAMREIEPEDVDDVGLEAFMRASDELSNVLYSFELKRRQRLKKMPKLIY